MSNSFFPRKDADLVVWATNFSEKIAVYGPQLGLSPEQITNEQKYCSDLITSVNAVNSQKTILSGVVEAKMVTIEKQGGALRTEIGRHKASPNYTETIGKELGIVGTYVPFDVANYKTKLSTELYGGFVRVKFRKLGADGINLYHRKKGTSNWLFLARATKSPFDDHIVLETPNQPEHWEYRAFGVLNDAEIGLASDIVEIVYGG